MISGPYLFIYLLKNIRFFEKKNENLTRSTHKNIQIHNQFVHKKEITSLMSIKLKTLLDNGRHNSYTAYDKPHSINISAQSQSAAPAPWDIHSDRPSTTDSKLVLLYRIVLLRPLGWR